MIHVLISLQTGASAGITVDAYCIQKVLRKMQLWETKTIFYTSDHNPRNRSKRKPVIKCSSS